MQTSKALALAQAAARRAQAALSALQGQAAQLRLSAAAWPDRHESMRTDAQVKQQQVGACVHACAHMQMDCLL